VRHAAVASPGYHRTHGAHSILAPLTRATALKVIREGQTGGMRGADTKTARSHEHR